MESKSITRNEEFMKAVEEMMIGNIAPITREETLWAKVLGENVPDIVPVIRKEIFLAKIAGADIQTPKPITREEMYLDAIANGTELKLKPITRKEMFYAKVLGLTDSAPEPVTRLEQILDQVEANGVGGEENYDKYSWEGVRAAIKNGTYKDVYKVGDLVPIDLGTYGVYNMQMVAFDADDKADGSGKAAISFVSKEVITTREMNSKDTNVGGWGESEMRSWLQNEKDGLYSILPDVLKKSIAKVNKTYFDFANAMSSCADTLWIPSFGEVFVRANDWSDRETSGATYIDFFNDDVSRSKQDLNGAATVWWQRSSGDNNQTFCAVRADGKKHIGYAANANSKLGVVIGFCV